MKLRNRIMSWILSPGAYAVWHAMGNPEEWSFRDWRLIHKTTGVRLFADIDDALSRFFHGFWFDGREPTQEFMGFFERHIVWIRGCRLALRLSGRKTRRDRNLEVFTKLTINE